MKTTQLNTIITSLVAAAVLVLGSNALAQPGFDRLSDDLNLTDEQREQLATLREEQREEAQALAEQRRDATEEQRETARAAAEERREAQQARIAEILTPEQMAQLEENRTAVMEQRQDRMERMDRMRDMGPRGGDGRFNQGGGRPMQGPGGQGPRGPGQGR